MRHFLFLFLLIPTLVFSQKRIEKTYHAQNIQTLAIDSDAIFQIKITAVPTHLITITTQIDGETYESALLNTIITDNRLEITTGRTPDYTPFNDKLSAHKVMSIVLEITVPEKTELSIRSTLASLDAAGDFGKMQVNLGRGGCRLVRFRESALINTISGNIYIETTDATVLAQSRNGTVVIPPEARGNAKLNLNSIHGDITVSISN